MVNRGAALCSLVSSLDHLHTLNGDRRPQNDECVTAKKHMSTQYALGSAAKMSQ
jgi:hypothetical protein